MNADVSKQNEGKSSTIPDLEEGYVEKTSDNDKKKKKKGRRISNVPEDELATLLETTNFSKREIIDFYNREDVNDVNDDGMIDYEEFATLCGSAGLKHEGLVRRLWTFFDDDNSGEITRFELVQGISPLLRGTPEDVANMFFSLYDVDQDGDLSAEDVCLGYADLMSQRNVMKVKHTSHITPVKTGNTSLMDRGMAQELKTIKGADLSSTPDLPESTVSRITDWVGEQRRLNGTLDREAFVRAVVVKKGEDGEESNGTRCLPTCRGTFYFCAISTFTFGGLFALFAVAAMTERFMARMDINEAEIGVLNTAYFAAGMISPFIGGYFMDNVTGPAPVGAGASTIMSIGALLQWYADTPDLYGLLVFARFLIGFGLETLFFATSECYSLVFPKQIGLMIGIMGLLIAVEAFAAFQFLPVIADSRSETPLDNTGTDFALFMCFMFCIISTAATYAVAAGLFMEERKKNDSTDDSDEAVLERTFAGFAKAAIPKAPTGLASFKLPASFYLTILGIKGVNYYFNTFSLYSVDLYAKKYGLSQSQASLATGLTSLIAGPLSPVMGILSDKTGARARLSFLAVFMSLLAYGFLLSTENSAVVWVATCLFAVTTSYCDLGVVTIPFIVGPARAGLGYGIYAILGNLIDSVNAFIAGAFMGMDDGEDTLLWFSLAFMSLGSVSYIGVYLLEKDASFLERPTEHIIETSLDTVRFPFSAVDPAEESCSSKLVTEKMPSLQSDKAENAESRGRDDGEVVVEGSMGVHQGRLVFSGTWSYLPEDGKK